MLAAVRVFTRPMPTGKRHRVRRQRAAPEGWPSLVLLLDTETTTDTSQRLRFGSYRLCQWETGVAQGCRLRCVEEGLFYGDDLATRAPRDLVTMTTYARTAFADVTDARHTRLPLYSRRDFLQRVLWPTIADGHALIVGFNLPFDLSRLAVAWSPTRARGGRFTRGFSLVLWDRHDGHRYVEDKFRPRLLIRHEDSKRARFTLAPCRGTDLWERAGRRSHRYTGRFLDLKTLAHALTGEAYSLASAAQAFQTTHQKTEADYYGPVTPQYVDYNRADVRVTQELLEALRTEFDRHPISVDPWELRSPASLAKGYLRAAGITPLALRARRMPPWVFGAAMEAYYGGRVEVHTPRCIVPVVHTDVTSMYPTVQTLARLSEWLTAATVKAIPWTDQARRVLASVTPARVLDPAAWPGLRFFAQVLPQDDVLPLRAQYDPARDGYGIAVTRVTSRTPLWYTGFDLAASVVLTGRVPRLLTAFTIEASGRAPSLQAVQLRGLVSLDPREGDLFKRLIEERHRVQHDPALSQDERRRLAGVCKVIANSGSYGIFAEMNPQDVPPGTRHDVDVICGSARFTTPSTKPEQPGEYCFPPLAALVTGAARLFLALMERLVTEAGGSYAFCDTDSMAIIASRSGGTLTVPSNAGVSQELHALSWAEVTAIVRQLDALKPYGPDVHAPLLKVEDVNFFRGRQIQLFAYGISAKRYCLFRRSRRDPVVIVKASEHGLGHLLNPADPEDRERGPSGAPGWIQKAWRGFVLEAQGRPGAQPPSWFQRPAVARHGFTSPPLLKPIARAQNGRGYDDAVKPFNFAVTAYLAPGGTPEGMDPATSHLIAPYEPDARTWQVQDWHDCATDTVCRVTTHQPTSQRVARVKSVADILADYQAHPEAKAADTTGRPASAATRGVLQRRHVEPVYVSLIGKETNRFEEVERGGIRTWDEVQEVYEHPRRTAWEELYLPLLQQLPVGEVAEGTGIARSLVIRYRKRLVRPRPQQMKGLVEYLKLRLSELDATQRVCP